jgi:hypothetical protein
MSTAEQTAGGWIIDGSWTNLLGTTVQDASTDIVCLCCDTARVVHALTDRIGLDPPLLLYFPRLVRRTFARLLRIEPPCAPGCKEDAREVFLSRNSIIWYCISHHWSIRKRERAKFEVDLQRERESGIVHPSGAMVRRAGKRRRIGGWGSEYREWWAAVEKLMKARKST